MITRRLSSDIWFGYIYLFLDWVDSGRFAWNSLTCDSSCPRWHVRNCRFTWNQTKQFSVMWISAIEFRIWRNCMWPNCINFSVFHLNGTSEINYFTFHLDWTQIACYIIQWRNFDIKSLCDAYPIIVRKHWICTEA